ncbi:MAG: O-acetyl-ADP-ribose deacetylase [Firmicutes bacterium]|nr:O-acetyl-ADP-ribose deacetylase [Bacillota bacterium]
MEVTIGRTLLRLVQGDITQQETDAIVNAANSELAGGGGVDGAIHRAGGPAIHEECMRIRRERGRLPAGRAVITTGGRLKARYVIHTVGPIWQGGDHGEDETLASAYRSSLELAREHGLRTVAFPSISTGAYGFPVERAARVALGAVRDFLRRPEGQGFDEVRFVLFSGRDLEVYEQALRDMGSPA